MALRKPGLGARNGVRRYYRLRLEKAASEALWLFVEGTARRRRARMTQAKLRARRTHQCYVHYEGGATRPALPKAPTVWHSGAAPQMKQSSGTPAASTALSKAAAPGAPASTSARNRRGVMASKFGKSVLRW